MIIWLCIFISVLVGILWSLFIYRSNAYHSEKKFFSNGSNHVSPVGYDKLGMIVVLCIVCLFFSIVQPNGINASQLLLPAFLRICIYYSALVLLLPFIRKYLNARACAALWVNPYIPLYMDILLNPGQSIIFLVIPIPDPLPGSPRLYFCIWLAGFLGIFLWNILSHFRFRNSILNSSHEVTDSQTERIWNSEWLAANYLDVHYPLVISPQIHTPLSIGLFKRTTYIVLPQKDYSPEELSLLLRHELIHIGRRDSIAKFFIRGSQQQYTLTVTEHYMRVVTSNKEGWSTKFYRLNTPLDWQYFLSLVQP